MTTGLTIDQKNVLDVCARIEDTAAQTYHDLATAHRNIPRLAALWDKTANEEENHARQFRLSTQLLDEMIDDIRIDGDRARRALEEMEILAGLVASDPPGPVDALRMAISAEEQFADFHMSTAAVFKDGSHKRLFEAMMAADRGHVEELSKELARLTGEVIPL